MNVEHFSVKIEQNEREWMYTIYANVSEIGLSWDSFQVAAELFFKKGKYLGRQEAKTDLVK